MSAVRAGADRGSSRDLAVALARARHPWGFLARRQRPLVEAALVAGLYAAYQSTRA